MPRERGMKLRIPSSRQGAVQTMKYTPEDLFQKCIGSLFVNESVDFFTKKVAMFLSMYMPISALFLVSSRGNTVTKLS